jgi:hypothetical protein
MVPGSTPRTRWADRNPSGMALTVMEMCFCTRLGGEVSEYERQCQRPSTLSAIPTYWPGW